ncbi:hypothetical protein MLD38_017805 [Melastoma candidum]|nr:hypothetical protein MLD38_017805 [Melastoma candidum]
MYREMVMRRIRPDLKSFNALLTGFCKEGRLRSASDVIADMTVWGVSPSVVSYNILLDGCSKKSGMGRMHKADEITREMNEIPNLVTYNIMINGSELAGQNVELRFESNIVAYNILQKKLDEAREMLQAIDREGLDAGAITFNTLIDGLCKTGKMGDAFQLRDLMLERGISLDVSTYNSLVAGLCKEGKYKKPRSS